MSEKPIIIASRGSALALAQANMILAQCRTTFPTMAFDLKIIKTTGDKLQTASMSKPDVSLPKGLFTKELEVALLNGEADLAVHSLKDLPTELPTGLKLGAVTERADVRDVLIYRCASHVRGFDPGMTIAQLPDGATVATSSTRRKAQLLAIRSDLNVVEIRGNVATRLQKLHDHPGLDATILAAAGLSRLQFDISDSGVLCGEGVPPGLLAKMLSLDEMLPCVGQGALGIEVRENDGRIQTVCDRLAHFETQQCALAERAFLNAMGGGCQSPVGACAEFTGGKLRLRAKSFVEGPVRIADERGDTANPLELGRAVALKLK